MSQDAFDAQLHLLLKTIDDAAPTCSSNAAAMFRKEADGLY
jgi:hypothetical protein